MTLCECIALLSCFSRAEDGGDLTEFDRPQVRTPSGKAAVASGVVDFENAQPAKESDLYPWGSVTKMFTAASVMKLVGSGKFRLDDAIAPLVDDLLGKMAAKDFCIFAWAGLLKS
eukprot:g15555.t1